MQLMKAQFSLSQVVVKCLVLSVCSDTSTEHLSGSPADSALMSSRPSPPFAVPFCASWVLWFGSCTLRLKWPPLAGALARNIRRKENRKPSDKHKTNPSRKATFPAREPNILQKRKVRLQDCRQGQLLMPRQEFGHIQSIAETLSQTATRDVDAPSVASALFFCPRKALKHLVGNGALLVECVCCL